MRSVASPLQGTYQSIVVLCPALVALRKTQEARRRSTLLLVAVIWLSCGSLFLLPYLIKGGLDLPAVLSHMAVSLVGIVLSIPLLAAAARLRGLSGVAVFGSFAVMVGLLAALLAVVDIAIFSAIYGLFDAQHGSSITTSYVTNWAGNFAIFSSQYSLIAVAFWTLETLDALRRKQVELEESRTATAQAQNTANKARLFALRYQLNPHFLFNTLNSISSLVMTGRSADAEEMLVQLSDFLRTTLVTDPEEQQTLEGELETIDAYLSIERIRFGDRLAMSIDCPAELRDIRIPHFLLQPLVENSIKHGVASCDRAVTISICAREQDGDLVIAIENDCDNKTPSPRGTGVGLRNVAERLRAVYGERGHLETIARETGHLAIVRVPLGDTASCP